MVLLLPSLCPGFDLSFALSRCLCDARKMVTSPLLYKCGSKLDVNFS